MAPFDALASSRMDDMDVFRNRMENQRHLLSDRLAAAGARLGEVSRRAAENPEDDGIELFVDFEEVAALPAPERPLTASEVIERQRQATENLSNFFRDIEKVSPRTRLFVLYEHMRAAGYDCHLTQEDAYSQLVIDAPDERAEEALDVLAEIVRAFCGSYGETEGYVMRSSETISEHGGSKIRVDFVPLH